MAEEIYCVGTVVTNRKEFPKFGKTHINALGRGDHLEKQVIGDAVHCFVWREFVDTICKRKQYKGFSVLLASPQLANFFFGPTFDLENFHDFVNSPLFIVLRKIN